MRVPPSLAYSATTSSFLFSTSSIKAGGHDHSRPTITPILSMVPPKTFLQRNISSSPATSASRAAYRSPTSQDCEGYFWLPVSLQAGVSHLDSHKPLAPKECECASSAEAWASNGRRSDSAGT